MNEQAFRDRVKRLQEVNGVLEKLDASIRGEAFALLKPYVTGTAQLSVETGGEENELADSGDVGGDAEAFFAKFSHDKPSDNVLLLAAHLYARFGIAPFTIEEIRELANNVGLTIPDRVDKTLSAAQREGKALFRRAGQSEFKPTVHGEAHLKAAYGVRKGNAKKLTE